jgi:DUF1365 family protein
MPGIALYEGTIRHRRFTPRAHEFTYSIFMAFLDVDRLGEAMAVSRLTGYNRLNWAVFDERDHFGDPSVRLRDRVVASANAAGIDLGPDSRIFLLTHLRYAGYVFNPISLFYCYEPAGELTHVLAEVNNTFGGRHLYWLSPGPSASTRSFKADADKLLYVSPFMEIDLRYGFVLSPPAANLVVHMNVDREGSGGAERTPTRVLDATLSLSRRDWSAATIRSALLRFPLMTLKVIGMIHWQALRLYGKGVPVIPRRVPTGVGERDAHAEACR